MSSRTAQREQARARRLAEERALAAREHRQRRIRMLAGIVLAAAAVIAVAVAISSGTSGKGGLQTGSKAAKTVASVQQLLNGIPQSGTRLGDPKAPVTIYYYGDLQCPVCQAFTLGSFSRLVSNDVRAGHVKVIYRSLETATHDPQTFQTQHVAALAAGQQQRFWNYVELFYHQQGAENSGYVNEQFLTGLAKQVPGLNFNSWASARSDSSLSAQLPTDAQEASAIGADATPTLAIQGPGGKSQAVSGAPTYSTLEQAVKSVA
jgi:protein-disulfide isomerase